jgi:hypothetical protein
VLFLRYPWLVVFVLANSPESLDFEALGGLKTTIKGFVFPSFLFSIVRLKKSF